MTSDNIWAFHDHNFLHHSDLDGKDVTLTIERIEKQQVQAANNKRENKPLVFFKGVPKGLVLNKTNTKVLVGLYGESISKWKGQAVTLYTTTTRYGDGTTGGCIRIRPVKPEAEKGGK